MWVSYARAFFVTVAFGALLAAPSARAQYYEGSDEGRPEFALSLGYSNLSVGGSDSAIHDEGAFRWEGALTFAPFQELPQLRMGGDLGVSLVLDNSSVVIVSSGGVVFFGSSEIPFWTIEPELRISWRQTIGDSFFIEPGVAGGVVFGFVDLHDEFNNSYHADSSTFYGRAFLRAGFPSPGGAWGFEGSYSAGGNMDFGGNASGDFSEWYIGVFGSLSF